MTKKARTRNQRVYKEALGIKVGDIVTTSYRTGPYEVWSIFGPRFYDRQLNIIIYPWPVISLCLVATAEHHLFVKKPHLDRHFFGVNEIHLEGDRYLTTMGDEIFVRPPRLGYPDLPIDMFKSHAAVPEPYPFREGVDYHAGTRQTWHCVYCGLDFNTKERIRGAPFCVGCGKIASTRIVMAIAGESTYRRMLG